MNGKSYFCACCEKRGIPYKKWFKLGAQNSQSNGGYVYHCPTRLRGPSHRYVVNYLSDLELYVAWNLNAPGSRKKTVFRILKKELEHVPAGELHEVVKSTHKGESKTETVIVFDRAAVTKFLKMVKENARQIKNPNP